MSGHRRRLTRLLSYPDATVIVVEHRDRLTRFGFEHLSASLAASGRTIVVLDDSACGTAKPKLPLRVRTFTCDSCGLTLDRDLNAALNLKQYVARSGPETQNGRGADQKTGPGPAGGNETSTPHHHGGQDGDRQPVTAGCNVDTH